MTYFDLQYSSKYQTGKRNKNITKSVLNKSASNLPLMRHFPFRNMSSNDQTMNQVQVSKNDVDELLKVIARDCIENIQIKTDNDSEFATHFEFSAEQNEKYKAMVPNNQFWGGYAYIDDEPLAGDLSGFIRLYSPWGSGKWWFYQTGEEIVVDLC